MIVAPRHYYITVRVKTLGEFQAGFFAFGNCNMFDWDDTRIKVAYVPFPYLIWKYGSSKFNIEIFAHEI